MSRNAKISLGLTYFIGALLGLFVLAAHADLPDDWDGKLLKGEPPSDFSTNMPALMGTKGALHGKPLAVRAGPMVTHDIMILWTRAAELRLGQLGINKLVQRVVNDANAAYSASRVNITVRLVYSGLAPVVESGGGTCKTLETFRNNAEVKAKRDQVKADFGMLLSEDTGTYIGCAALYIINGVVDAFDVMKTKAVANNTGTHELGHLNGISHNIENTNQTPAFPWGYGYRYCATTVTDGFRDVMCYACGGGLKAPRYNFFGNPDIDFKGRPTGTQQADAAQALNDNAAYVATYR